MSASLTSAISKKSPKSCEELATEAVIKQSIAQGKAGKGVLDEAYPKPVDVFYVFLKGPDSVHDDTEGLILASNAQWLKILLKEHGKFAQNKAVRGSLGGFKLCWDEKGESVEWASELIFQLDKEEIKEVVGKGLGLTVDFHHNPDDEENDEDEGDEEDEDVEYDVSEWCDNNADEIEKALDTKLGELFATDAKFVSPATIKEWEKLNRGYKVLGSFHIEMTNWE